MSYSALKKNFSKILDESLLPLGFVKIKPLNYVKQLEYFDQGIYFNKHTHLNGTIFLHYNTPFGIKESLNNVKPLTYKNFADDEQVQASTEAFKRCMRTLILPYFDNYQSLESLLKIEDENLAFGEDVAWRASNKGWALINIGKIEEGRKCLREVLNNHSDGNYDYVKTRKEAIEAYLREIN